MTDSDKHPSLLRYGVNYCHKSFIVQAPGVAKGLCRLHKDFNGIPRICMAFNKKFKNWKLKKNRKKSAKVR